MKTITTQYINGQFVESIGREVLDLLSPTTKTVTGRVTLGNEHDARQAVQAAQTAFKAYSKTTVAQRCHYLQRLHDAVAARTDEHVALMIEEYGGVAFMAQYAIAGAARSFLNAQENLHGVAFSQAFGDAHMALTPLGVAALITPWNVNTLMICQKLAPALAAGCTVVIKPSELSARQTQLFLECLHAAGLPAGVVNVVNGHGDVVGQELTTHPDVAKVSFTGSTAVGKAVMRNAAETMKRVTLELGGKSATIFLEDVDLAKAIPFALQAGFMNNGQACIAGTRILVPESRLEEVKAAFRAAVPLLKVGNPQDADTAVGPLATEKQYQRVQRYIRLGIAEGAEVLIGGPGPPPGLEAGYFVQPTVFVNVTNEMTIAREEIFGPVLSLITYQTEAEAIDIANASTYGLFAWISTTDPEHGQQVANQLEAGTVMVNEIFDLFDFPQVPVGGFKQSGLGREFGVYGIEEYLQTRSVFGKPGSQARPDSAGTVREVHLPAARHPSLSQLD